MFFRDLLSWLKPSYYLIISFILFVSLVARAIAYRCIVWRPMTVLSSCLLSSVQNAVSKSLWQIGAELYLYRTTQMCQNSKFLVHSHMFFFHSRILLNWKTMILERFSDLTWGPAHCTPSLGLCPAFFSYILFLQFPTTGTSSSGPDPELLHTYVLCMLVACIVVSICLWSLFACLLLLHVLIRST